MNSIEVKRSQYTATHIVTIFMMNDWTLRADSCKTLSDIPIPEYAAVYARYNKTTNETEIRFTWSTIEKGIV